MRGVGEGVEAITAPAEKDYGQEIDAAKNQRMLELQRQIESFNLGSVDIGVSQSRSVRASESSD